ncbi:MAG: hypothetical protein IT373_12095 [Polyangiaceae bacterium]|nr:hypothetical protein [Polyangiaceae bacterium]
MDRSTWLGACVVVALVAGCSGESDTTFTGTGGHGGLGTGGSSTGGSGTGGSGTGGNPPAAPDPNLDGPYTYAELDAGFTVAATGHQVAIHCAYPTAGPDAGPYPVVVFGHGFQLPPSQYYGYVRRLASFGYVALTVDFPAGFVGNKHTDNARDLVAGLDWAAQAPELAGKADTTHAGASGHSLGGKAALLGATYDARIDAAIALDPVDSAMQCSAQDCPDVSALMPGLAIPTGFVGELTDATGGFQACAPAADNYTTFYAGAQSPSLEVTVVGANHMSFLDDVASCGFTCSFCNAATLDNATVNGLGRAYVVAFYERWLRGLDAYDSYLTGALAEARYVGPGLVTLQSK